MSYRAEIIGLRTPGGTYDVLVKEGDAVIMYAGDVKLTLEDARASAVADLDKQLLAAQLVVEEAQRMVCRLVQIKEAILVAQLRPTLQVKEV